MPKLLRRSAIRLRFSAAGRSFLVDPPLRGGQGVLQLRLLWHFVELANPSGFPLPSVGEPRIRSPRWRAPRTTGTGARRLFEQRFPNAVRIVGFFHAIEYLWAAACAPGRAEECGKAIRYLYARRGQMRYREYTFRATCHQLRARPRGLRWRGSWAWASRLFTAVGG